MGKTAPLGFAVIETSKKGKRTAYLIAVRHGCEPVRVYAVVALSVEAALAQVGTLATGDMQAELVGGLSRNTARRLGLKPDEMRQI